MVKNPPAGLAENTGGVAGVKGLFTIRFYSCPEVAHGNAKIEVCSPLEGQFVGGGLHPQTFHRRSQEKLLPWNTWAAMILLIAPLFIFGLHPPLAAQLAGFPAAESSVFLPLWEQIANGSLGLWAAILLPPVMGYGLYRSELTWPPEMIEIEKQLLSILRLDWLHRALGQLLGRARQFLWGVGAVLHGEGYLAWVALSLLLIFLLVLSR